VLAVTSLTGNPHVANTKVVVIVTCRQEGHVTQQPVSVAVEDFGDRPPHIPYEPRPLKNPK